MEEMVDGKENEKLGANMEGSGEGPGRVGGAGWGWAGPGEGQGGGRNQCMGGSLKLEKDRGSWGAPVGRVTHPELRGHSAQQRREAVVQPQAQPVVATLSPGLQGHMELLAVHTRRQPGRHTVSRALRRREAVGVPRTRYPRPRALGPAPHPPGSGLDRPQRRGGPSA